MPFRKTLLFQAFDLLDWDFHFVFSSSPAKQKLFLLTLCRFSHHGNNSESSEIRRGGGGECRPFGMVGMMAVQVDSASSEIRRGTVLLTGSIVELADLVKMS